MKKYIFLSIAGGLIMIAYQNCGSKSFSARTDKSTALSTDSTTSSQGDLAIPGGESSSTSGGSSSGGSSPTTPQQVDEQITTAPTNPVSFQSCQSFQELTGDSVVVPARAASNICYYIRLMSARPTSSAGAQGEALATDVVARAHSPRPDRNNHPYVIGDRQITSLQLLGTRSVALSSDFRDAKASMSIDNFFLVEQSTEAGSYRAWAYGTADAEPSGGKILINSSYAVNDFYSYASGGTARVSAIDMTSAVPANLRMSLRFRALDCGAVSNASDVFMVFH